MEGLGSDGQLNTRRELKGWPGVWLRRVGVRVVMKC